MAGGQAAGRMGELVARGIIAKAARSALRDAEKVVTRDAAKRGETRATKQILDDTEKKLVANLSEHGTGAIHSFVERARSAAGTITPKIDKIVHDIPGASRAGEGFETKSEGSLQRKVATYLDKHPTKSVGDALGNIKDSVRYTIKSSGRDYQRVTQDAVHKLKEAGFVPVEVKNSWGAATGYRGINSVWRDTATGHTMEVQFHTAESFAAKERTHAIYDFQRLPNMDPDVRRALDAAQNRVFDKVHVPDGSSGINWPTRQ